MNKKLLFVSLIAISPLLADDCCPTLFDSCLCDPGPETARFTVRSRQPGGIGYPTGYTSIDLFYAPGTRGNFTPFIDLRSHVFNDGKPAFNTGLGLRYLPECSDVVYGINAYWDYRQAKHASFNQVGLGLEALWTHWDLHLNGYAPVSRHKKSYRTGFLKFQGNEAFFYKKYELAMWGGDLALGYQFYSCNWFDLHATLDGYYFQGDYGEHAGGGFFRLRSNVCDYFTLEGQVSYDSLFKWNGQGELAINFAFGKTVKRYPRKTTCCDDILALEKHLVEKPDRFEIMPTTSHKKRGRALDPTTGLPLRFLFVDNTSHSAGTFESPYSTLAQAVAVSKPADVIYIFPGDGTSTGLTTSTILQDRQSLVGSGAPFEVATRFGQLVIPQMSTNLPQIEVSAPTAIEVANGNAISGLSISCTNNTGVAIKNHNPSAIDLKILKSLIISKSTGILAFVNGNVIIQDNEIFATNNLAGTIAVNLFVASSANVSTSLNLSRNRIDASRLLGIPTQGTAISVTILSPLQSALVLESNEINFSPLFSDRGIYVQAGNSSNATVAVRSNRISTSAGFPSTNSMLLISTSDGANVIADIDLNRVFIPPTGNADGIVMTANGPNDRLFIHLTKNQVDSQLTNSYLLQNLGNGALIIDSPNGKLSGVQNINIGQIASSGDIQFAPLQ